MAFTIKYARLFEVRVLHEYFLNLGGRSFFDLRQSSAPEDVLALEHLLVRYDLSRFALNISPTEETERLLDGHRMKFKQLPYGFLVGTEIEPLPDESGFKPKLSLNPGIAFEFFVEVKDPNWQNYTNLRLTPNLPAIFYFSNYRDVDLIRPSSLARSVAPRTDRSYEMGELVSDDDGTVFRAKRRVGSAIPFSSSDNWETVADNRYVTYRDRLLLPLAFPYYFTPDTDQEILESTFTLIDPNGNTVHETTVTSDTPLAEHFLNYRKEEVAPGVYTLQVIASSGYLDEKTIVLNDRLYQPDRLAVISIAHQPDLGEGLNILDENGHILMDDGEPLQRLFELRFQNRATIWRYIPYPRQELIPAPTADVDTDAGGRLVTKEIVGLTETGTIVHFIPMGVTPATEVPLPNPVDLWIRRDETGRYFSDIQLGKLDIP